MSHSLTTIFFNNNFNFNKLAINTKQVTHPHLAYAILGGGLSTQSYKKNTFNYITELTVTYRVTGRSYFTIKN